jgi:predicted transcriptional regulator
MNATTLTVKVDAKTKERLDALAESTGRSPSNLAADAIEDYLDLNDWQVTGIKDAIASLDRGEAVPHEKVRTWVESWGGSQEGPRPSHTRR